MSTPYFLLATRGRRRQQQLAEARRLRCRCGGAKAGEHMIVCLACFQSAPLAVQRDAYSRVPEVRRTAARQLLTHAGARQPRQQLSPGGEPTTETVFRLPRLQAEAKPAPAPAGATFR